ncbi:MAG: hypothetical protein K6F96_07680 [Bacteroidales bacterium]|nr:hypothetical protein [Bacteroidales bacterium]
MKKRLLLCLMLSGFVLVAMAQVPPIAHIEANNVRGVILGDGTAFLNWPENYGVLQPNPCPTWEVPAGSGKSTIFQKALWFGGLDAADSLHLAAMRYGQGHYLGGGQDYWAGPLKTTDASIDLMTALKYHHVWSLTRAEIEQFKTNFNNPSCPVPEDILSWPAHGEGDYAYDLAPYIDVNNDGRYNPADGDYPDIKGDQCLFFIFNDSYKEHGESFGGKLGLEVHVMVYAFEDPFDEALNNTVFTHFEFFNRSSNDYHDVYLGLWFDWDLGYANDDYVGCDVQRNSCFVYNGMSFDGSGEPTSYGDNPPAQVATVLSGPEGKRMTGFLYHNNDNSAIGDPENAPDYYNLLQARWKDGSHLQYGGIGYPGMEGTVGPDCNYMFPGDSDPDNLGTNGIAPNEGYNTNGKYWTEETTGNQPSDRRGLAMVGPFRFPAGGKQELDYAEITVWKGSAASAKDRIGEFVDHITALFNSF